MQKLSFSRAVGTGLLVAALAATTPAVRSGAAIPSGVAADRGRDCDRDRDRSVVPDWGHRPTSCVAHVLLISIDGMHEVDLRRFVATHPHSALAALSRSGVTYSQARTPVPTDSFPGLLALTTGGHPASTGVYYENSFDRTLFPPKTNCTGPRGTTVFMDESIDYNPNAIDGGGGVNPALLTQERVGNACRQVFPHDYLRVNTIFEVVKAHGGRTAWSDKEQSYEILDGPSGRGVDDLYDREIAAGGTTGSLELTEAYDDTKVAAILNEIDGKTSRGVAGVRVPALFGMNFQAVSVGQKLAKDPSTGLVGGYTDAAGTPGTLLERGIEHTDASIGKFLDELAERGLAKSTLVVISAKHGQQPIDRRLRRAVDSTPLTNALAKNLGNGFVQTDDLALIWLQDRSDKNEDSAFAKIRSVATIAAFEHGDIYTQGHVPEGFGPFFDPRTPDFSLELDPGAIYTGGTKIAEHGGFSDEDRHVALLVARVGQEPRTIDAPVETTQVAPTILEALGIDGARLQAVRQENTRELPGLRR